MHMAAMRNDQEKVFELAASGHVSVTATDALGRTLFHHLAAASRSAMIPQIVALGGDDVIDAQDHAGDTALTLAVSSAADAEACVRALLEAGADPSIPGRGGLLPVELADLAGQRAIASLLREYG
ncbi:hypothetical protein FNF27_08060 [Cafeteria roenbergensis]|uniref:Uncharacterized protein n=3 Tax=Cafeteria roenbergensis TaxID=33653 RepID=A0A5A8DE99_CAFRO|nr:hypothetical protein FNF29_06079 [Cafeteria roenbergensis]KAA0162500.1 hypothetical protein FNF27_08060 [Cafeteria roenbergensis]|eukprot:KAA0149192.1 hypothetical protein FNF29_06079 [Cafeteria roenbergensis]